MSIMPNPLGPIDADLSTKAARVAAYAHNAGWSGEALVIAIAVAKAESGWKFDAKGGPNKNGTYDYGLFQINEIHKPSDAEKTMPLPNAKRAFAIYKGAGNRFSPWSAYNNGAYKKHMTDARNAVKDLQRRGSDWERETIKNAGKDNHNLAGDPDIPNPLNAVGDQFSGITNKIEKFGSGLLAVMVALVFIGLGVAILLRSAGMNAVTKQVRKAVK